MAVAFQSPALAAKKSFILEPFDPLDGGTLYHFDTPAAAADKAVGENPPEKDGPSAFRADSMEDRNVKVVGEGVALSAAGRFGGGLSFAGGDGRLVFEQKRENPTRAIEFWVRIDELPANQNVTLFEAAGEQFALHVLPAGGVVLQWQKERIRIPNTTVIAKQWMHIAIGWSHDPGEVTVWVNSYQRLKKGDIDLVPLVTGKALIVLGNAADGKGGFRGTIDELRISAAQPAYYRSDLGWVDLNGEIKTQEGPPLFRDAADLLFRLDFNQSLVPVVAPEKTTVPAAVEATVDLDELSGEKKSSFPDGVERQSLRMAKDGPDATFTGVGLALQEQGTIALWMRPANWNNGRTWTDTSRWQRKFIPLFELQQNKQRVSSVEVIKNPYEANYITPIDVQPGQWMHVILTWSGTDQRIYVNGKPWTAAEFVQVTRTPWDAKKPLTLTFPRDAEDATLIDDFRIYRRALSELEITNLARLFDRRQSTAPLPAIAVTYTYNGLRGTVGGELMPLLPAYRDVRKVIFALHRKGEAAPIATAEQIVTDPNRALPLSIKTEPFGFGDYEIVALAADEKGNELARTVESFSRVAPPWLNTTLGKSDKVMPDWTPVHVNGNDIAISGRTITLNAGGLPEKIISANGPLLAGPLQLELKVDGKPSALKPTAEKATFVQKGEVQADFSGALASDQVKVETAGFVEFDGLMWFTLTLSPARGKALVSDFTVRIPYTADSAKLMHWWSGNPGFRDSHSNWIGATPAGEGVVFESTDKNKVALYPQRRGSFMPYVMLTGDQRGMAFFAENDQGWTQSIEQPAVRLERTNGRVDLVLHIISEPITLDGPRAISFGLHPTPVKPLEKGWRMTPNWGLFPDSFHGFNLKGEQQATWMYRYPENDDWSLPEKRIAHGQMLAANDRANFKTFYGREPKERETRVIGLYSDMAFLAGFPEHTREWAEQYYQHRIYTPEMVDFTTWAWDEWLGRGLAKGIYMDDCFADPRPGAYGDGLFMAYKLPDGTIQPGFSWFGPREMMKRMRQASYDRGVVPHLCAHATHTPYMPFTSFFDVVLDGEDFYPSPQDGWDFIDAWPRERLQFNQSDKWGLINTWLSWTSAKQIGLTKFSTGYFQHVRAYVAGLLAHDLIWTVDPNGLLAPINPGGGMTSVIDFKWLKESQLRLDPETAFLPYWNDQSPAKHQQPQLTVSVWRRKGLCVVGLVNWGTERIEAEVQLDLQKMGFDAAAAGTIKVRDVDSSLLSYFDDDVSKLKSPDAPKTISGIAENRDTTTSPDEIALSLEDKQAPTLAERKTSDPDGKFEWKDGVLRCPVRRHDYRLFEFRTAD